MCISHPLTILFPSILIKFWMPHKKATQGASRASSDTDSMIDLLPRPKEPMGLNESSRSSIL